MDALTAALPRRPDAMRAVVLEHFGGPEHLRVSTVATPAPKSAVRCSFGFMS
jgi:hypothetical protein